MRKMTPREKKILWVTTGFFLLFGIDRLLITPLWSAWQDVTSAVRIKEDQLAESRRLLAEKDNIQRAYAAAFPARRPQDPAVQEHTVTSLLKDVEALARQNGIKIRDIKPQSALTRSKNGPSVFISVESSWESLAPFIYRLQQSSQLLHIQKADISRTGDTDNRLSAQFVICGEAASAARAASDRF